jgi:hypothetical protein
LTCVVQQYFVEAHRRFFLLTIKSPSEELDELLLEEFDELLLDEFEELLLDEFEELLLEEFEELFELEFDEELLATRVSNSFG